MASPEDFARIVSYDPVKHGGFLRASWTRGARYPWMWLQMRLHSLAALVAEDREPQPDQDELLGVAVVEGSQDPRDIVFRHERRVVWCYVRASARRMGVAKMLLSRLRVDTKEPTPVVVWTPTCTEIARVGKHRIYFDPYTRGDDDARSSAVP